LEIFVAWGIAKPIAFDGKAPDQPCGSDNSSRSAPPNLDGIVIILA